MKYVVYILTLILLFIYTNTNFTTLACNCYYKIDLNIDLKLVKPVCDTLIAIYSKLWMLSLLCSNVWSLFELFLDKLTILDDSKTKSTCFRRMK